jgi:HSP20 family protein
MSLLTKWNPFHELEERRDWPSSSRWNPFQEMERMRQHMENVFGPLTLRGNGGKEEVMTTTEWAPLVDISEDDEGYLIKAELPELRKEDVKVTVEKGVLTLSGERKFEKEEKDKKYHRLERAYGSFLRSFSLPDDAEAAKVSAEFKDGVLKVHLAKNDKAKTKAIEVRVA